MRASPYQRSLLALSAAAFAATVTPAAASFEVAISPSRFELSSKSGSRLGQSLNIFNVGSSTTEVLLRTLDWSFSDEGNVTYHTELLPGSCRPWVTLERKILRVAPQAKINFRFQIDVPPEAARSECRFMLAVEGVEPVYRAQLQGGNANLNLPVSGRIAVAVYVMVNGAEPKLQIDRFGVKEINGRRTPVITVTNKGDAHGRLEGGLASENASGAKFDLLPESTPILPGQTRTLPFHPKVEHNQKPPDMAMPIKSSGQLDWDMGSFKVTTEFK